MALAGLIDPRGPALPEAVAACVDRVFTNAYAAGVPDGFIRLRPGNGDHLFAARLLLRDDVPSLAVEPVTPAEPLERELARYWLARSERVTPDRLWPAATAAAARRPERRPGALAVFTAAPAGALAASLRAQGAALFGAEPVALLSARFDRTLFILGNAPGDAALAGLLRRFGGDVVLTASCLLAAAEDGRGTALAAAELGRAVPAGEWAQWREGIGRPAALLLADVAASARMLFVPSAWLSAEVAARYGRSATVLPLAADAGLAPAQDADIRAVAAGLHAEACVWAIEHLGFTGTRMRLALDCPDAERPALAALAARLGIGDRVVFGPARADLAVVLAMRGGPAREAALAAAARGRCVASRHLVETIDAPGWVVPVPDQPSPPLLAAAIRAARDSLPPDAAAWVAAHDPAAVAALLTARLPARLA